MSLTFVQTARIKKAVELINDLSPAKFPKILSRIVQKLHLQDEHAFSEEEEEKLELALSVTGPHLKLIIETCEFFLHQAAYHIAKPAVLQTQLEQLALTDDKVSAIVTVWENSAKDVIDKLRHRTLPPKQLESVSWRLGLQVGSSTQAKTKATTATVQLGITDQQGKDEKLRMEFTHDELYKFYDQLETIQSQIDSLS